jgi:hypothetical protein
MGRRVRTSLILVVLLLAGCKIERTPERRQTTSEAARESITRARGALATAMIKHDANAIASLFAPTGVLVRGLSPDVTSPGEVQRHLLSFFRDTTVTWFAFASDNVDLVTGGGAFETGLYEQTVMTEENIENKTTGRYAIRWAVGPEATHRIERLMLVPQIVRVDTVPQAGTGG